MIALSGLFLAAFLAATPVPFQSELVFLGLQSAGWRADILVFVASIGNVLGSCITYGLGRWLAERRDHRWFPVRPAQLAKAEALFSRWGVWALLLSWAPGGDLIVAMSGVFRVPFLLFLTLVALAKTGRYAVVGWLGATAFGG